MVKPKYIPLVSTFIHGSKKELITCLEVFSGPRQNQFLKTHRSCSQKFLTLEKMVTKVKQTEEAKKTMVSSGGNKIGDIGKLIDVEEE